MLTIDTSRPVMVTGATGYVAGWVVRRLLEAGVTVHAAVRDPDNLEKRRSLDELAASLPGTIRYFKADLLDEGSYDAGMAGCGLVFHTASPFFRGATDPQAQLVDPAVNGTRNVLEAANRTASVKRVVLTSSCAAIYGDNADITDMPGRILTEQCWNTTSSLAHNPYQYSKLLAEQAAWRMAEAQSRWRLVVVNPAFVLGPAIGPTGPSESFSVMHEIGNGRMKAGAPAVAMGIIDVRDLADAHLRAGYVADASGRYIISGHDSSLLDVAKALRPEFDAYPVPRRTIPKWLVWLVGPIADKAMTRRFLARNVGHPWKADHGKSVRELGMRYRSLGETVQDMFRQMVDTGKLPAQ